VRTFIAFGNLKKPFNTMCKILIDNEKLLPRPLYIQAGPNKTLLLKYIKNAKVVEFCDDFTFEENIRKANIVICHAGVGTINLAILHQKYPAVFARSKKFGEHIDNHQIDYVNYYKNEKSFSYIKNEKELQFFINNKVYLDRPAMSLNVLRALRCDLMNYIKCL